MKKIIAILYTLFTVDAIGQQYWQQKVDHTIDVSLNAATHELKGFSSIHYTNNSPDTLTFIWFHLWPNAYKNEKTAFSIQLLENGDTRFYFSDKENRGYIDQLNFKIGEIALKTEEHPKHIDIIKLLLPEPLLPGKDILITTPFHVKLPFNFSRGGRNGETYQITQWYPKPAVYDAEGWHPMPYLDQGEFYSEFGDYQVSITVPYPFAVAATGVPQQPVENAFYAPEKKKEITQNWNWEKIRTKTLRFSQTNIHDFAWFADPTLTLHKDTIQLPSGKIIQAQVYFHLDKINLWQNSLQNSKDAIHALSSWIGDYPYSYITVLDGEQGFQGGMEYPGITILTGITNQKELDLTIFHELGHNWFYGALGTNERHSPWMDEGMNSYYEKRYEQIKYPYTKEKGLFGLLNDPRFSELLLKQQIKEHKDQPINTSSPSFTAANYEMIAYTKAALWMKKLETLLGTNTFDNAMREYYANWKFKHPNKMAFKQSIERVANKNLDSLFTLLDKTGFIEKEKSKPISLLTHFRVDKIYDHKPIFITPTAAYTDFNGIIGGFLLHNFSLPISRFTMLLAPFYGFKSQKWNGWSRFGYTWYPSNYIQSIEISNTASRINTHQFKDTTTNNNGLTITKIAPSLKINFKETDPRSTMKKSLHFQFVSIREEEMRLDNTSNQFIKTKSGYGVLLSKFALENSRTLNPWKAEIRAESHNDFYRLQIQGKYLFNFAQKGGIHVRFFAGKFMYKGNPTFNERIKLERYHLQMTGPNGFEDYTYSTPYLNRFANEGFGNQQIMERDGFFKVRTDQLSNKIGRSDTWLSTINIEMDVPDQFNPLQLLPIKIPVRLFMDVGTNGNIGKAGVNQPAFLYDGGFQISLLKNTLNFYFPIVYSRDYKDYFLSSNKNGFLNRMSFSINIQDLKLQKLTSVF